MRIIAFCALVAALPVAAGCAIVQEKTIGESLDSTASGATIKTRLLSTGGIARFGEADVVVEGRMALLAGRVPSEEDRIEAERIAWTVSSVDEVANELVVDDRNILRDINDPWIAGQVRTRLLSDNDITGVNYKIHVYNGVVYLLGLARSEDELVRAADHASRVSGVKKVISYVKMRERKSPPVFIAPVGESAPAENSQPPAPIVQPERQPTQRGAYSDPYAGQVLPLPGSASPNSSVESGPLPPPR